MNSPDVLTAVVAFLGGGGLAGVTIKLLNRDVDEATAEEKLAGVRTSDVEYLRSIIAELRQDKRDTQSRLTAVEERLAKVEERERHMLTRAAVHEAWDQLAFAALVAMNPQHPPPPPLVEKNEITGRGEN